MRTPLTYLLAALTLAVLPSSALATDLVQLDVDWAHSAVLSANTLAQSQPQLARDIATGDPGLSRSGQPVFPDATWRVPEAAGALLVRIAEGGESADVRVGLLDALSRTKGDWAPAVVGLLRHETHPDVRRMMVEILREAPIAQARAGVTLGLSDSDVSVRAAAVRVVGNHFDGAKLGDLAVMGLRDHSPAVRTEAARSIGYAGFTDGFGAVKSLLSDSDSDVRYRALRSLQKLDASTVAGLPELSTLAADADPRISREASLLLGR